MTPERSVEVVDLRCERHKHGELDIDRLVIRVRCGQCSRAAKRTIEHEWSVRDLFTAKIRTDLHEVPVEAEETAETRAA